MSRARLLLVVSACAMLSLPVDGQVFQRPRAAPSRGGVLIAEPKNPPIGPLFHCGTSLFLSSGVPAKLALSGDAQWLAVADSQSLRVQEALTGKERWRVPTQMPAMALAYSTDGTIVGSADFLGLHLRDGRTGKPIRDISERQPRVAFIHFSAKSDVVATATESFGFGNSVRAWDLHTGKRLLQFTVTHNREVQIALSADGKLLACWGSSLQRGPLPDNSADKLQLWDVAKERQIREIACTGRVGAAAFLPDGKSLAISTGGNVIGLYDTATGKMHRALERQFVGGNFQLVKCSADGSVLALARAGSSVLLWDIASGKRLPASLGPMCQTQDIAFTKNRAYACGNTGAATYVWDVRSGAMPYATIGHSAAVESVAFSPDGKELISEARGAEIRRWDASTGHAEGGYFLNAESPNGADSGPWLSRISPAGKYIVCCRYDGSTARLLDPATGKKISEIGPCSPSYLLHAPIKPFSANDEVLLVPASPDPQMVAANLFDAATGKLLRSFEERGSQLVSVAVAPDREVVALLVASAAARPLRPRAYQLHVRETFSGKERFAVPLTMPYGGFNKSLVFSPDGDYLLLDTEGHLGQELFDTRSGKELGRLFSDRRFGSRFARLSPDGKTVAIPFYGDRVGHQIIQLWEVASRSLRAEFDLGNAVPNCLAFSPDGKKFAAGARDGTVVVWVLAKKSGSSTLSVDARDHLWRELASTNGELAYEAMLKLYSAPHDAVALVQANLPPVTGTPLTQEEIVRLIARLDSPRFTERVKASAELSVLGKPAEPLLRKALETSTSPEVKERVQQLLDGLTGAHFSAETLRPMRAIEILEHINSAESREVLKTFAQGAPEAALTRSAKSALERLGGLHQSVSR